MLAGGGLETPRVVDGGDGIVDRARPHDDDEAVVPGIENSGDRVAAQADRLRAALGER